MFQRGNYPGKISRIATYTDSRTSFAYHRLPGLATRKCEPELPTTHAIYPVTDPITELVLGGPPRPATRRGKRRVTLRLPNRPQSSSPARALVSQYARLWGFSAGQISDITLAVGEAISNALEHGCSDSTAPDSGVSLSLTWDGKTLGVRVRDAGPGFDPEVVCARVPDSLLAERGRGLGLMALLMDRVEHVRLPRGMEVRMQKRLHDSFEGTTVD